MKNIWCSVCLCGVLFSAVIEAQTVFSWIDEKGVIHYTDKQPAADVRLKKQFMEFEISIETDAAAVSTPTTQQIYQPTETSDDAFSWHAELSPSCRWIAKRIALLEALMEQQSSEYDQILKIEVAKRQHDWLQQGCFSAFK